MNINTTMSEWDKKENWGVELERFFSISFELLCIADSEGTFIKWNKAWENDLGYKTEDLLGRKFSEFVHPDDIGPTITAISELAADKTVSNYVNRYRCKDGSYRYLEWRTQAYGQMIYSAARDITEKIAKQNIITEKEGNFKTFFETVDDLIFIATAQGAILHTNCAVIDKLGYSDEELCSMHILDVHPENYRTTAEEIFSEMFKGIRDYCPLPLKKKDGSFLPVETRVWLGKWNGVDCIYGISKDLSEQQALLERFHKLFDNNPALMAVSDVKEKKFIEVNNSFLDRLGYSKDEVLGKTLSEIGLFIDNEKQREVLESLEKQGQVRNIELKIRKKNGSTLIGLFSGEVIDSQGSKNLLTVMVDISEQKALVNKIEEQKNYSQMLLNTVPSAVFSVNNNCEVTSWNNRAEQITGFTKDEIIGQKCTVFADEPCRSKCGLGSQDMKKPSFNKQCMVKNKAGEILYVSKNVDVLRNYEGSEIGGIECFEDITERLKVEERLKESEKQLAFWFNTMSTGVVFRDANGKVIKTNKAAENILGLSVEQLSGKISVDPRWKTIREDESEMKAEDHPAMISLRIGQRVQNTVVGVFNPIRGEYRWININAVPEFKNNEKKPYRVYTTLEDITEQKKHESEMIKKENVLSAVAASIKQLLGVRDYYSAVASCFEILGSATGVDRVYLFENSHEIADNWTTSQKIEWSSITSSPQLDNPELQNIPIADIESFVAPLIKGEAFYGIVKEFNNDRTRELLELQNILSVVVLPVFVKEQFWGFIGFDECKYERRWTEGEFSTLSAFANSLERAIERRQVEDELEKAKSSAESANVMKSQFLANMSHEIRTPMNGILGYLDLLQRTNLSSEQKEYIKDAKSASEILLYLINDILDFSKIEAGKLTVEQTSLDVRTTVLDAVAMITPKVNEKKLEIHVQIKPDVPEKIVGDPARLRQVINNLISNAIKFTEKGEISIEVSCGDEIDGKMQITFKVRDTGIGISADAITRLFRPFTQADASTTRKFGGTGLGLAISRELVRLMDGDIQVESVLGQGSSFDFYINAEVDKTSSKQKVNADEKNGPIITKKTVKEEKIELNPRILLAEDNEMNIKIVSAILKNKNYTCDTARDGAEALKMATKKNYDIIFMDCQMPVMDGYESTAKIRAFEKGDRHTMIVAMTANAMEGDRQKCIDAGMDDYISKPLNFDDFYRILEDSVKSKEMERFDVINDHLETFISSSGLDVDVAKEIFADFVGYLPELLKDIEKSIVIGDFEQMAKLAHQLKGSSGNLRISSIYELAIQLEKSATANDAAKSKWVFADVQRLLN